MTVSSIGSGGGRDYSTIASWEAAAAATLTAPWEGECYNDSEFSVAGTIVTFAGITASATNFIELRPASGQGFKDHASAASNPLRYDQTKGVGLKCTANYVAAVVIQVNHVRLRGLQILHTGGGNDASCVREDAGGTSSNLIRDCILESTGNTSSYGGVFGVRGATVENVVTIHRGSGTQIAVLGNDGPTVMNCTMVRPADLSDLTYVFSKYFGTACTVTNTAGFGCTNFFGGAGSGSGTNNATDLASVGFGSGHLTSLTYADQFENENNTTPDFRLKAGSDLIDAGTGTGAPTDDIIAQARSTTDIGAWEYQSGGGGGGDVFPPFFRHEPTTHLRM